VRKHAVLRTGLCPATTVGSFLLAEAGPPAFVLRSRRGTAHVALEVIDKLTENVEMVAWLIRVSARRRACPIHCFFVH
jgi:hypothetical protein